ncbi:outer membrane beta-barrel family protein [Hymenobacter sp. GOD-10R]|uniref:outer membrane beta-barrel family protein n=1 Tax=Hymenobacter sp. GOD-10R TaxID=3093922 RepID=UPI002D78CB14|nr:outer membrane beta-barrel family protein [Hymenobacter sp. GOD-10R]WRQ30161.1 outer membrane beta-barrel family protein [Hymenobacter sp. GOD-10R]
MKKTILCLALASTPLLTKAQAPTPGGAPPAGFTPPTGAPAPAPKGSGKLTGTVLDAATKKPVPFATVALLNVATGKAVDGTVCDDDGKLTLSSIAPGSYTAQVSFLGYKQLDKVGLVFTEKGEAVNLGQLTLASSTTQLAEVRVEGQRALIEEKVDRTVYNAEKDETTRGGDATDVLKRVPLLSVDLDGNVSLRGSSNIKVLINNKPSTIAASNLADALKQIPADQIKSVEVITSPSAKYDAEGSGGIINIITKKDNLQGKTLDMRLSGGLRGSDLGLNASYKVGKMGFSLGGGGRTGYNTPGHFSNTQLTTNPLDGSQLLTTQEADTRSRYTFGRYNFGWDYDIDKQNSLSLGAQVGVRNFNSYQSGLLTQTYANDVLRSSSLRNVRVADETNNLDVNLTYTHLFEKPQHEFSFLTLYSRTNAANNFTNNILGSDNGTARRLKNENDSYNQEVTVQADYQVPIGKSQLLELGGKDIMRRVRSEYTYLSAEGDNGEFLPLVSSNLSNVFTYNQNVAAAYVSYTLNFLKSYTLKAGTRYEHTTIDADFQTNETVSLPSYGVLVPSVNLSRKLKNGNLVKVAYNRRIQRPSLQFLNPNLQASNPLSVTQGNPLLRPEYTNNVELSYSTFLKSTMLNFSAFARNTTGSIQAVRSVLGGDTIQTTYANIGQEKAYGLSAFANVNLNNKLTLNGGPDLYYAVLNNNVSDPLYNAKNRGWVVSGRLFGNYTFAKNWGLQFFGFYRGRQVQLQGYQSGFGIYSLNIKRDLWDKKGSIGFGAENFLTPTYKMRNEIVSPLITQNSVNEMRMLSFRVNFSYRIGKLTVEAPRRKKSVNNDDLKGGGNQSTTQPGGGS